MKTPRFKGFKGEKAQAIVEFALTIPIVLILTMGVIEGGWLMFVYASLTSSGREAARYGAGVGSDSSGTALYNDCDGIKAAALRLGRVAGVTADDIHIFHDSGPDTPKTEYCTAAQPTADFVQDDRIDVEINITYLPISPITNVPTIPLHSQNAHTILLGADVVAVPQTFSGGGLICDVKDYEVKSPSPLGPTDSISIINHSAAAISIVNVLIVWDTTSGPVLNQVGPIGGLNSAGPTYSSPISITIPAGGTSNLTLKFSKALKTNVIFRLTLAGDDECAFGQ